MTFFPRFCALWLALGCGAAVVCAPFAASAQEQAETTLVVVLELPGGDSALVQEELASLSGFQIEGQRWFLRQLKSRGIRAKRIMSRPKDLRWAMDGAEISAVVAFEEAGDAAYSVSIYGSDGTAQTTLELPRTEAGLDADGVAAVRLAVEKHFGIAPEPPPEPEPEPDPQTPQPQGEADVVEEAPPSDPGEWLLAVRPRFLFAKRDFTVSGSNGAVLNFQSGFFPAAELEVTVRPSRDLPLELSVAGGAGFDSLTVPGAEAGTTRDLAIRMIDVGLDASWGLLEDHSVAIVAGGRWTRFGLPANDVFPALSHLATSFGVAGRAALGAAVVLRGEASAIPFALPMENRALFGESGRAFGAAVGLGADWLVLPSLSAGLGYRMTATRTLYSGSASLQFADAAAFELVQAAELGITWRW